MKPKHIDMAHIITAQKIAAEEKNRAWWFAADAMRFFDTMIESEAIKSKRFNIYYFITSEQFHDGRGYSAPRAYSIRMWSPNKPSEIDTLGQFQQYSTLREALADAIKQAER